MVPVGPKSFAFAFTSPRPIGKIPDSSFPSGLASNPPLLYTPEQYEQLPGKGKGEADGTIKLGCMITTYPKNIKVRLLYQLMSIFSEIGEAKCLLNIEGKKIQFINVQL